jgi:hypothetical protein
MNNIGVVNILIIEEKFRAAKTTFRRKFDIWNIRNENLLSFHKLFIVVLRIVSYVRCDN